MRAGGTLQLCRSLHPVSHDEASAWSTLERQIRSYDAGTGYDIPEIDAAVARFGDFGWEVGPYFDTGLTAFALSPGWNSDSLAKTERIVAGAPSLPGIVFKEAKLPKDWQGLFQLQSDDGPVDVDCSKIGFELDQGSNGDIELAVRLESRLGRWKWDVVSIWIDSEIGERNKILRLADCRIETREQMPDTDDRLRDMFFSLVPDACYREEVERMVFERWSERGRNL